MTARESRFEVVRTNAGWHARHIAANGRVLFTTESYTRKRGAENAIESLTGRFLAHHDGWSEVVWHVNRRTLLAEVRYVDERTATP